MGWVKKSWDAHFLSWAELRKADINWKEAEKSWDDLKIAKKRWEDIPADRLPGAAQAAYRTATKPAKPQFTTDTCLLYQSYCNKPIKPHLDAAGAIISLRKVWRSCKTPQWKHKQLPNKSPHASCLLPFTRRLWGPPHLQRDMGLRTPMAQGMFIHFSHFCRHKKTSLKLYWRVCIHHFKNYFAPEEYSFPIVYSPHGPLAAAQPPGETEDGDAREENEGRPKPGRWGFTPF